MNLEWFWLKLRPFGLDFDFLGFENVDGRYVCGWGLFVGIGVFV